MCNGGKGRVSIISVVVIIVFVVVVVNDEYNDKRVAISTAGVI